MNDTTTESTTGRLEVGAPVFTPDGQGRVDGFFEHTSWVFGRSARHVYVRVELDEGSCRVYPAAQVGAR
jgi:hypothetical protein